MVEKHVRYTEDVATLTDAWAFVMNHVDEFATPNIEIQAFQSFHAGGKSTTGFAVTVHGSVNA